MSISLSVLLINMHYIINFTNKQERIILITIKEVHTKIVKIYMKKGGIVAIIESSDK